MKRPKTAWSNPDPTEAKRPLVMVVDDDRSMRMILVAGITQNGYGVVTAEDGVEGLRIARLYRPDLILTDALMPKMDGREMARHVRETLPHAAIVVMTSVYRSAQQKYEALRDFGADGYLVKPIHARVLADLLGRYLKRE